MRIHFVVSLLITLLIAGTYWYQSTAYICPTPLYYSLGELDESFGLSEAQAKSYIEKAESYWEEAAGRELFVYEEGADFKIEFVFDERQELANEEEVQQDILDQKREENETIIKTIETLQAEYDDLSRTYKEATESYDSRLQAYNQKVNKYNDRGGAPEDVYQELQDEREDLNIEADTLNQTAAELNGLAKEINRLSERGNRLVDNYNQEVSRYNSKFAFEREFTQGDYQGDKIHIYKFSSEAELLNVLAHEFGHALGINHVEDSSALMYYLLEDSGIEPVLAPDDIAAFNEVCGQGDSFAEEVRRFIRSIIN